MASHCEQPSFGDPTILHVDMDAFFAAVEQNDRPELRGKPVLIGGDPTGRGVVSTASYEARPFGCRSAMPMSQAIRLCPDAIIVYPRMSRYAELSSQVFDILESFTPLVEPLSIDEAFLDVAGSVRLLGDPREIAKNIKHTILHKTNLVASVGVAPNKFLAKLASDHDKPDGLVIVEPENVGAFLDPLPISRMWGVGKATLPKLERLGVGTFADLKSVPLEDLQDRLGSSGERFYQLVRGIDRRRIVTDRQAKSISHELTFDVDITDDEYLRGVLLNLTDNVARRLRRHHRTARTATLKVRSQDFSTVTRNTTLNAPTDRTDTIWNAVASMFDQWRQSNRAAVRLIGAGTMNFESRQMIQMDLFENSNENKTHDRLDETVDEIRDRFGRGAIDRGASISPHRRRPPNAPESTD